MAEDAFTKCEIDCNDGYDCMMECVEINQNDLDNCPCSVNCPCKCIFLLGYNGTDVKHRIYQNSIGLG